MPGESATVLSQYVTRRKSGKADIGGAFPYAIGETESQVNPDLRPGAATTFAVRPRG